MTPPPRDGPDDTALRDRGALAGDHHRVLVSTDIGGTDPDDFQSMVHLLLYADVLEIEGLLSSPYGQGRVDDIHEVLDRYEEDYPALQTHGDYPDPDALRAMTKQGAIDRAGYSGVDEPTEGSEWLVERARADDPRPLHVLCWGGIEDVAQAVHDAPDVLPELRVYWIGGPNKKWSPDAYQYLVDHHPELWIVENNATYRGWFVGGEQSGEWGNEAFVDENVAGRGALGEFFAEQLGGRIKMGDTPSVAWLLRGDPSAPEAPSWGGRFVRAWERPHYRYEKLPGADDEMQTFGVLDLALPLPPDGDGPAEPTAHLEVTNQSLPGHATDDGTMRFRFSPKVAGTYEFTVRSDVPALDGETGAITAVRPSPDLASDPSERFPNWWTDDPSPALEDDGHIGARTVNRWREQFLGDFAARLARCTTVRS